jgi:hypothetical protein
LIVSRRKDDELNGNTPLRRQPDAREGYRVDAQARLDALADDAERERIQREASRGLAVMREDLEAIKDGLALSTDGVILPDIVILESEIIADAGGEPLIDSRWDFIDQTRALKDSRGVSVKPVDVVLAKLHGARRNGDVRQARCAAHEDDHPSRQRAACRYEALTLFPPDDIDVVDPCGCTGQSRRARSTF